MVKIESYETYKYQYADNEEMTEHIKTMGDLDYILVSVSSVALIAIYKKILP
jgi:hypothetical protein